MLKNFIFDIETAPLPTDQIMPLMPEFEAPGNIKDPEKIAAAITAKMNKWIEQAALSAITGKVLCIAFLEDGVFNILDTSSEDVLLDSWWPWAQAQIQGGHNLIGFCCKMFDLPFLIRRSWAHSVPVPKCIWNGRYFSDQVIDVAEKWQCGVRGGENISLDQLSKFLGIGQKNGKGEDFAALWASDKAKALQYVENDLRLTQKAYERMG